MKVIIAGGRDYRFTEDDVRWLDELHAIHQFTEVVSGAAKGADTEGERWAESCDVPVVRFPARWRIHGNSAGAIRNKQMADYLCENGGGMVILFPGGVGTANMHQTVLKAGLRIIRKEKQT